MFDAKELQSVFDAELDRGEKLGRHFRLRFGDALLAVAAHVRKQTLREAAGVCDVVRKEHIKATNKHRQQCDKVIDLSMSSGAWECANELEKLAADATGKDGVS